MFVYSLTSSTRHIVYLAATRQRQVSSKLLKLGQSRIFSSCSSTPTFTTTKNVIDNHNIRPSLLVNVSSVKNLPKMVQISSAAALLGKNARVVEQTMAVPDEATTASVAASTDDAVILNIENAITKSPHDDRSYRGFTLGKNKLKVLVIHDATSEKAAASLDVNVGTLEDPKQAQGLAHFLEHMVFLGSKKFPVENEFDSYVASHGGSYNAYTSEEHTNFYFDVAAQNLKPSLDRFAQFFISPSMSESGTEREVKAVNSEHENNVTSDHWRLDAIGRVCGDPEHPWNYFGTGNIDTLWHQPRRDGTNVRSLLLDFHKRWYTANIMSLCILGCEPLDELQQLAVELFSDVPAPNEAAVKGITSTWIDRGPPLRYDNDLRKIIRYTPVQDVRTLTIEWPLSDYELYWRSKPLHYLSDLIGHEGEGSILSELKRRNWALSLAAGCEDRCARGKFATFTVQLQLSVDGLQHINDIISIVYDYLRMLEREGPQRHRFDELAQLDYMKFLFRDKSKPMGAVRALAHDLHEYPVQNILEAAFVMNEWRPELISEALAAFRPDNMRVLVTAKDFAGREGNIFEQYYKAEYGISDIDSALLQQWKQQPISTDAAALLHLPEPNKFIPHKFDIKADSTKNDAVDSTNANKKFPYIIHDSTLSKWWYKIDTQFRLPKAVVDFEIQTPVVYESARNANLANLLVALFHDAQAELTYPAELAGLKYVLSSTKYGLLLQVRGFDEKQADLIETVLEKLIQFEVDETRFANFKEAYARGLKNFFASEPFKQIDWYFRVLMTEKNFTKQELIAALDTETTVEALRELQKNLLQRVKIEGLIHGNVTEVEAKNIAALVDQIMLKQARAEPADDANIARQRVLRLPPQSNHVLEHENNVHLSNCVAAYYQIGTESARANVLMELLDQILSEPCFDQLRTKEQLGYIVFTHGKSLSGVNGLQILVQSSAKSVEYLDDRIEKFLYDMTQHIESKMDDAEFLKHIEAVATRRLEKPKSLAQRAERYWNEIFVRMYHFAREEVEVAELRRLKRQDVVQFLRERILSAESNNVAALPNLGKKPDAVVVADSGTTVAEPAAADAENTVLESSSRTNISTHYKHNISGSSDSDADNLSTNAAKKAAFTNGNAGADADFVTAGAGQYRAKLSIRVRSTAPPGARPSARRSAAGAGAVGGGSDNEAEDDDDDDDDEDENATTTSESDDADDIKVVGAAKTRAADAGVESAEETNEIDGNDISDAGVAAGPSSAIVSDLNAMTAHTDKDAKAIDQEAHSTHTIVHDRPSRNMLSKDALHVAAADAVATSPEKPYEPSDLQKKAVKIANVEEFKRASQFHDRPPVYNDANDN